MSKATPDHVISPERRRARALAEADRAGLQHYLDDRARKHGAELRDALRDCLIVLEHGECEAAHPDEVMNRARAALAKAGE